MLVLERRLDERIRIGTDVWITVVSIGSGKVSIGVDAPKSIEIHREEVIDRFSTKDGTHKPKLRGGKDGD